MSKTPMLVAALLLVSSVALAGNNASLSLEQGVYKMSNDRPKYGPSLPVNGPVIRVHAETGSTYSHVAGKLANVHFVTKYTASCTGNRYANSVQVKIGDTVASDSSPNDGFERGQVGIDIPYGDLAKTTSLDPAGWCNDQAKTLSLEKNVSRGTIVENGFTMKVDDRVNARGTLFCTGKGLTRGDTDGDSAKLDLWISCEPKPNAGRPKAAPRPGTGKPTPKPDPGKATTIFKRARLTGPSGTINGKCPHSLKYTARISSSGPGTVEYQFIGDHGYESPVKIMSFTKAQTKTSTWTRMARVPDAGSQIAAPGGGESADIEGWMALKVIHRLKNEMAYTKKTWTSPKKTFAVNCVTPAKIGVIQPKKTKSR